MTDVSADESAIRTQLSRINDAWLHQRGVAMTRILNECFAEDVVMRGPGFTLTGKGREWAVQSYVDFTTPAEVKAFTADEPDIDISGDTAISGYQWQMTYVLADQEYTEQGHDLFVFSRRAGKWLVIWRALLSS
jgi:Domain of unknown function (DUF4440)